MKKVVFCVCVFFKGTLGLFGGGGGGGGTCPSAPPLGSGTGDRKVLFLHFYMDAVCLAIVNTTASDLDLDKCSDVRMRENYATKGIPKTSYRIHHLYVC